MTQAARQVQVQRVECITPDIKRFTLAAADGDALPQFSAGSHVIVNMIDGELSYNNAYSLMSAPGQEGCYRIAVRRDAQSRGGSAFLHDRVQEGDRLWISAPNNLFGLHDAARHHVLIAGGIGITPFIAHVHELNELHKLHGGDATYELHYAFRSGEQAAFCDELRGGEAQGHCRFYDNSMAQQLDIAALLAPLADAGQVATHVYVCGPASMIEAVQHTASAHGIDRARVHWEQFAVSQQGGQQFSVVLARSGRTVEVGADESILAAIEREQAAEIECLCREGVCGTCETRILEGAALHRDQYLSDDEKAAQKTMMICVSRAQGPTLVLDL